MDLDVIMPFHRGDEFLYEAVKSLVANTAVNFRLIAVDDRIDQGEDLSRIFSQVKNLELVKTPGGSGYGQALKIGSEYVRADSCALMNSDDVVHPERFIKQLKVLNDAELVVAKMQRIDKKGKRIPSLSGSITSHTYDPCFLLFGSYGADATWCMRSSWWKENAFFDTHECLDWRIGMQTFGNSTIKLLNEKLYFYRKHNQQVTANTSIDSKLFDPVYLQWRTLSNHYELEFGTRAVFDLIATPWRTGEVANKQEIYSWISSVKNQKAIFSSEVYENIENLILRRFIFASRLKMNPRMNRARYFLSGSPALPKLITETASTVRN